MVVAYRDLSGNNPTNHLLDRPTLRSAPAVEFGAIFDCSTVDQEFPKMARALHVGAPAGSTLEVVDYRGNTTVFNDIISGTILDVQASGTRAAGSNATEVIPLY